MRRTILIFAMALLLTGCVSQTAVTQNTIPASDTPSPTLPYTPEPSSTITITPTPVPSPTATESAPPLPVGAVLAQKVGQVWIAFDSMGREFALWLPDPDITGMGWRQRYVKNNDGVVLSWNSGSSEWVGVPQPEDVVEGWMDLDQGRPVWKMDVSPLQRNRDVVIGELIDDEWQPKEFEVLLPDEVIANIHNQPPYSYRDDVEKRRKGNRVTFSNIDIALLGLKYSRNSQGENEILALVGGNRGVVVVNIGYIVITQGGSVNLLELEFRPVSEIDMEYISKIMRGFVRSSEVTALKTGSYGEVGFGISYNSIVRNSDILSGGCDTHPSPSFQKACIESMQKPEAYRPVDENDLENHLGWNNWTRPLEVSNDWWKSISMMPDDFMTLMSFNEY